MSTSEQSTADIERARIANLTDRLKSDFPEVPDDAVAEVVDHEYHHLDEQPIRDFVPVLVEHNAKDALRNAEDRR